MECPEDPGSSQASGGVVAETADETTPQPQVERPTRCTFFAKGACKFGDRCHNWHDVQAEVVQGDQGRHRGRKVEQVSKGKAKMRTAMDVIKRIKWDERLPEDEITVGYRDRFVGIKVRAADH